MTPAQSAAFRLSCDLANKTLTHERGREHRDGPQNRGYIVREPEQRGSFGTSRPVRVGKRLFKSVTDAKQKLRVSPKTLYAMLDDGRAKYEG